MRILIVEDEPVHARYLTSLLRELPDIKIASIQCQKTLTAAECFLLDNEIDLLFLDLNVYGENGFNLLQNISSSLFCTIVVSAHTDRAIEAFDYGVLDFIAKPVSKERLLAAMNRFKESRFNSREQLKYFSIYLDGSIVTIPLSSILYFESSGKKMSINLRGGEKKYTNKKMIDVEKILPSRFRRIHKSYIANLEFIHKLTSQRGGKYEAVLQNGSSLPVSRNLYSGIKQKLMQGDAGVEMI
jgi:DNA-binding LytR/AlgR family response regulator